MKFYLPTFLFFVFNLSYSQSLLDENPPLVGSIRYVESDVSIFKEISKNISEFIKVKDNFITNKADPRNKDELFTYPFKDFYQIENVYGSDYKLVPNLISLYKVDENIYIAKIMWAFHLENGGTYLHMINNFLIYYDKDKFELKNITSYNLKNWTQKTFNNINYIYRNTHVFNDVEAKKMLYFDEYLSDFFEIPSFNFTYILCENTNDLQKTLGYDFNLEMFGADTISGSAILADDIILAGNNSEYYPHELVHLYVFKKFGMTDDFLNEGIATYLGGSVGLNYEECLQILKKYYTQNPENDFLKNAISRKVLNHNLSIDYISAAFICEIVYKDFGKQKLFELLSVVNSKSSAVSLEMFLQILYKVHDNSSLNQLIISKLNIQHK